MALIKCVECGKEISDKASSCPNCGAPISAQSAVIDETKEIKHAPKKKTFPKKTLIIACSIIGIAIITGIAYFGLTLYSDIHDKNEAQAQAAAAQAALPPPPVTLINTIENLQAHSWKSIPMTLPYSGTLTIEASIENGNGIHIELINREDLVVFENKGSYGVYPNFSASQTQSYKRSSRMAAGNYYLLLQDKTWGIFSSKASDVRVSAQLASN